MFFGQKKTPRNTIPGGFSMELLTRFELATY
nr:MAG TPA: hypothetical protein [Caudoviricetes sp.]